MNPDFPTDPRQALEASLTALLLGELPDDQARFVRQAITIDPELARQYERLRQTIDLVREAEATPAEEVAPAPEPLKLSADRREQLLQQFKTIRLKDDVDPVARSTSWLVPTAIAACFVLLLGALMLAALSKAKSKSMAAAKNRGYFLGGAEPRRDIDALTVAPNAVPTGKAKPERAIAAGDIASVPKSAAAGILPSDLPPGAPHMAIVLPPAGTESEKATGERGRAPELAFAVTDLNQSDNSLPLPGVAGGAPAAPKDAAGRFSFGAAQFAPRQSAAKGADVAMAGGRVTGDELAKKESLLAREEQLAERPIDPSTGLPVTSVQPGAANPTTGSPLSVSTGGVANLATSTLNIDADGSFTFTNYTAGFSLGTVRSPESFGGGGLGGATTNAVRMTLADNMHSKNGNVLLSEGALPQITPGQILVQDQSFTPERDKTPILGDKPLIGKLMLPGTSVLPNTSWNRLLTEEPKAGAAAVQETKVQETAVNEAAATQAPHFYGSRKLDLPYEAERKNDRTTEAQVLLEAVGPSNAPAEAAELRASQHAAATKNLAEVQREQLAKQNTEGKGLNPQQFSAAQVQPPQIRLAKQQLKIASLPQDAELLRRQMTVPAQDSAPAKPATPPPTPQPEIQTRESAFSTFSLNVSDVSFKLAAASLEKGVMPDPGTIRSEEFINAFDYRDPEAPPGVPIAFAWERAGYPFAQNRDLLRFSVKTAAQGRQAGRALNLVLLLDNSGSMERADRVSIIREALRVLAAQLQPQDTFSVVSFAIRPQLRIDGVPGSQAGQAAEEVSKLTPQGGTNLEEAMNLAYQTALRHYLPTGINRVVLLTDGAANLGNVDPDALKQKVEANRKQGIALDCFGIGWEGYNDDLLEVLSRNGDGRYGFINDPEEAVTEFAGQLAGALHVAASDVKVQVEFNPARVSAYRQIGYAKHQLTKEQFRDNTVDAAEIGAAESGNALYVIEANPAGQGSLATVRVRYKVPGTDDYREQEWAVPYNGGALALEKASPPMRLAATASAFSEWLAGSPYAAEVNPDALLGYLRGVPEAYGADARPKKLEWMLRQAKSLAGASAPTKETLKSP